MPICHRNVLLFILSSVAVCNLASDTRAQTPKTRTAPPGLESRTGGRMTTFFGSWANTRYQAGEGTMRGVAMSISKVDYRTQTWLQYSSWYGMGRVWSNVTLKLSKTTIENMSVKYSGNPVGPQSQVYSTRTFWPTITTARPVPVWGKQVSFPFSKPWSYDGKADILFDYTFRGGQLLNKRAAWNNNQLPTPYALDGVFTTSNTFLSFPPNYEPRAIYTPPICNDPANSFSVSAYASLVLWVYNSAHPDIKLAGKARLIETTAFTAPNAASVAAFAYGGSKTGVKVGARCNNLHVDLNRLLAIIPGKTSGTRSTASYTPGTPIAYKNAWAGHRLWMQGAWADSKTGQLSLSLAANILLPRFPELIRKRAVANVNGTITLSGNEFAQTLPRFTYK